MQALHMQSVGVSPGLAVGCARRRKVIRHRSAAQDDRFVVNGKIIYELADVGGVRGEIEGQKISIRQAECGYPPELGSERVILVARVAEVVHPVEVIVGGVVNTIIAFESQSEHGHADEIEKDSVITAAADAGVGEGFAYDSGRAELAGLRSLFLLALDDFLPGFVESFAGGVVQATRGLFKHRSQ